MLTLQEQFRDIKWKQLDIGGKTYFYRLAKELLRRMSKNYYIENGKLKKKIPIWWWTHRRSHLFFIARELTSLCVAYFALFLLFLARAIKSGPESYTDFTESITSPIFIIIHLFVLGGLLFHTITWLNLAPKATVIKIGKKTIPSSMILAANYGGWIAVSGVLVWILLMQQ